MSKTPETGSIQLSLIILLEKQKFSITSRRPRKVKLRYCSICTTHTITAESSRLASISVYYFWIALEHGINRTRDGDSPCVVIRKVTSVVQLYGIQQQTIFSFFLTVKICPTWLCSSCSRKCNQQESSKTQRVEWKNKKQHKRRVSTKNCTSRCTEIVQNATRRSECPIVAPVLSTWPWAPKKRHVVFAVTRLLVAVVEDEWKT